TLTSGSGAGASAGANSFRSTGFQNNGISTANTDYYQFTISAASGDTLSLSTLDARLTGTSSYAANPGVRYHFGYSLVGVNFTLIGSAIITTGTNVTMSQDLTGISALQNLSDTVTVTFRYYASGQTTTGGWGFFSNTSGNYGLSIDGSIISSSGNTITVTQATGGTISPGTTSVADNGNQNFTATPDACYTFSSWTIDGTPNASTTNPYSFTNVTADHTITAVYTTNPANNITASAGVNGTINPNGVTAVACGGNQSYSITPDPGYIVQDVLVNGVCVGAVTAYDFNNV